MTIETGNVVVVGGKQYLVTSVSNGVHGVRVTDEELAEGADLGGRDRLYLGTCESLASDGAEVFAVE